MTSEFDPAEVVRQVTQSLIEKFPSADPAEVQRIVAEEVEELEKRPVHDYVSVLSAKAAKRRLKLLVEQN